MDDDMNMLRKALWGFLRPLLQLVTNLLNPKVGARWLWELKRFLREEPCWYVPDEDPISALSMPTTLAEFMGGEVASKVMAGLRTGGGIIRIVEENTEIAGSKNSVWLSRDGFRKSSFAIMTTAEEVLRAIIDCHENGGSVDEEAIIEKIIREANLPIIKIVKIL